MRLQAAIAGTGFIGGVHARSARFAGAELAGVAASSPASAQAAAAELGAERAFDSAEEMMRDPGIDVMHICTPNYLHLPLAEACAGSRQARDLREAACPRCRRGAAPGGRR